MVVRRQTNLSYIPPPYIYVIESIKQYGNPMGTPPEDRVKPPLKIPKKAYTLYYAGCTASLRYKRIVEATTKILAKIGCKFTMLGANEVCCGYPLRAIGLDEGFREIASTNAEMFHKAGIKKVITTCPGCLTTLGRDYEETIGGVPFEVMHITEVIVEAIKEGKLHFKNEMRMKAAYHDPCHLGRYCEVYDPPRKIAVTIPGLTCVEMGRWCRDAAWCCGGPIRTAFSNLATAMSKNIILEAKTLNVDSILTTCPTCLHSLSMNAPRYGLKVYDLTELTAAAMGLGKLEKGRRYSRARLLSQTRTSN